MTDLVDRLGGAFFIVFGLLLYFLIIPAQTEPADSGWVYPETVPNALAWSLCVFGSWILFKPSASVTDAFTRLPRAAVFLGVMLIGAGLMNWLGFIAAAPLLVFALMWMIGERRPLWFVIGVIVIPLLIWLLIVPGLERVLPQGIYG